MKLSDLSQSRDYQFWALQLAGWSGWVVLFALRDLYWGQPFERIMLLIVDAIAGLALTTGLRYVYRAIWEKPVLVRVVVTLVASYATAAVWQPIKNYSQFVYYDEFDAVAEYGYSAYFSGIIGYSYFLMLCWSGLYFGLKFYNLLQEEQEKSIKAQALAHESQLRMLRYQLNPHFLFNTLNAISTLVLEKNNETASEMVRKLSHFLRYSLDKDPMQKVDLEHEIGSMKLYLDIEQVRFDERLSVEFDMDDAARKAMVPSMILQPLVENSIKYAVASRESGGRITISAKVFAGDLLLAVTDDGPGIPLERGKIPEFSGVGITNTRERLKELYGDRQSCRFSEALPHGLQIEIRIPYETE
ncbi:MAG: histidine kinase [Pseudomonadales bacterium]|nr:histidine kinase [Pseudomonadales bacterium]